MITALGESPENCGYEREQIDKALKQLANTSVKQIGTDAGHLYHLLLKNGCIERNAFTEKLAKEHPTVMQLRFDNERSTLEDMPEHLRKPLFSILSKYSDGVVIKKDKQWVHQELSKAFLETKPYKLGIKVSH